MKRIAVASPADAPLNHFADPSFSSAVIAWQKQYGRHVLPWQNTRDAYRVWLSEIMLQQTQVAAVIPYYLRFLEQFPDVESLAAAPSEAVMALWSGLGYYSRARNLHRCAQRVVAEFNAIFPDDPELLQQLPGIGRSTAAAIAAFSYGTRAAILDGNVKRVFARVFGVDGYPGTKSIEDALWQRAVALLPELDIEAYTQGLMDLGATLCTRANPACSRCPLATRCVALATGRVDQLPVRKPRKTVPEKHAIMLVIADANQVLLQRRPEIGIWGGLLSLPELDGQQSGQGISQAPARATLAQAVERFGAFASVEALLPVTHGFTHFKLHIAPYQITLSHRQQMAAERDYVWVATDQLIDAPLPAPIKKLLVAAFGQKNLFSE
ncbi:MAG: A/G-specific adenine glycosylase [Pseudomonadota bacterium]